MRRLSRATLVLLALMAAAPGIAFAFATERVIIVVFDGCRDSEFLEQPGHANTPQLWNVLRPQGYLSHAFYNDDTTRTVPGHTAIASGNFLTAPYPYTERADRPFLWEYLRSYRPLPDSAAVIVSFKDKLRPLTWSNAPGYGPADSALFIGPTGNDVVSVNLWKSFLALYDPIISFICLGHSDGEAHSGNWPSYNQCIHLQDSLTAVVWNHAQSRPGWAGHTTLFVTGDHGRHTFPGDWREHGDLCLGCRHLGFLAAGPDFVSGVETAGARAEQRDIAATVATLLQFPAPQVAGRVMTELFLDPGSIPGFAGATPDFRLTTWPNPTGGAVHLRLDGGTSARLSPSSWLCTLHDAGGRQVTSTLLGARELGQGAELTIPGWLPAGPVWIRLQPQNEIGTPLHGRFVFLGPGQNPH